MILNPLDLPEIRCQLAEHLEQDVGALATCAQVCKGWRDSFNPIIWRTLSASALLPKGRLHRQAFEQNGHLIRDLTVGRLDTTRYCLDSISHLTTLQLEDERELLLAADPFENYLLNKERRLTYELATDGKSNAPGYNMTNDWILLFERLLCQNTDLKQLRLKMDRFEPTIRFWEGVCQSCHHLEDLECMFTVFVEPSFSSFLKACTHLRIQSLTLQYCTFERFPPELMAQYKFSSLKSFTLAANSHLDIECQLQWFRCCPNLESLTWSIMGNYRIDVDAFCAVLSESCPNISSLTILDRMLESHQLARILLATAGRLHTFVLKGDSVVSSLLNDAQVMAALMTHSETLRHVEFGHERGHVEWDSVHQLLTKCPLLETLVVHGKVGILAMERENIMGPGQQDGIVEISDSTRQDAHEDMQGQDTLAYGAYGVHSENRPERAQPWVCLGLRKFQMMLNVPKSGRVSRAAQGHMSTTVPSTTTTTTTTALIPNSTRDMTQGCIMEQLGRLIRLEELLLGPETRLWMYEQTLSSYRGLDFRLEAGLGHLASLVSLKRLDVDGIQQQQMGPQDVLWMLEHWPSLCHVKGDLHFRQIDRAPLDAIMSTHGFQVQRGSFRRN
ncbi:hypothetical protein BGZ94_002851 [Podila epigama]|nr:hypothetical protein BGZ94_002851 [Podila epigama]